MSTWYLAGGGPSLKNFDWSRLYNKNTIAINRSFQKLPNAPVVLFQDFHFWQWYEKELVTHPGLIVTCEKRITHPKVNIYKKSGPRGIDERPGYLRTGNNSGFAAINLAYHLGAKTIFLLGYDMQFKEGESHWHNGYKIENYEKVFKKMIMYFESVVVPLEKHGIDIYNACPDSKIECFTKVSLGDI